MNGSKVYGKNVTRSYNGFAASNLLPIVPLVDALGRGPVPPLQPTAQPRARTQANDHQGKARAPDALALLVAQSNHRVEPRRFVRGPNPEE